MLTQYAFSILFIDKKKAKFSNDRFGLKNIHFIVYPINCYIFANEKSCLTANVCILQKLEPLLNYYLY